MLIYNQSEFSRLILTIMTAHSEHYLVVTKKMMMTVSTSMRTVMTMAMMRMVEERCEEGGKLRPATDAIADAAADGDDYHHHRVDDDEDDACP